MSSEPIQPSQRSLQISIMYTNEADRAFRDESGSMYLAADEKIPTTEEHKEMCREFLGMDNPLTDQLLKDRLDFIAQDSHLKEHFHAGNRIQLAVIPFSTNGNELDPDEIDRGDYLRNLVILEVKDEFGNILSSKTISGFSFNRNEVHKLMPGKLAECSFIVPEYSSKSLYTVTKEERQKIMQEYEAAFRKLQQLFE